MDCTNSKSYWSSTLDSRHDCSSSVCCKHGNWVNLHQDELVMLKDSNVPICDWTLILRRRDAIEKFCFSAGRFIGEPRAQYYQLYLISTVSTEMLNDRVIVGHTPNMVFLYASIILRKRE